MSIFQNPTFLRSTWSIADFPPTPCTVVFAGRSNVGKSSVLNALCGGRFARVARTPGRTRAVNLFQLRSGHILADLPGYGYAAVAKTEQQQWRKKLLKFMASPQLCGLLLIVDCRRGLQEKDYQLLHLAKHLPTIIVLNKADKLNRAALLKAVAVAQQDLITAKISADLLTVSALKKTGIQPTRHAVTDLFLGKTSPRSQDHHHHQ